MRRAITTIATFLAVTLLTACGARDAPPDSFLDGVANRDGIGLVAESEHGQQHDELELAER